ncbi:MAG: beta-lactamase family protein [Gemmataceae bacterium]|nr:beta-lactamase family protein [Gemmataceae bacterium]
MIPRMLAACLLFAVPAFAQDSLPANLATAVDTAVRAEMEKQQVVGAAVGIIREGQIVYRKGYGLADRETKAPVTVDSVFNWASNSKPLAAVLAMQLVEAKKLDLDADVRTYVPEFPDKGAKITTRHLLCHQSGIPHYSNGTIVPTVRAYTEKNPFLDPIHSLDKFNRSALIFKPGEKVDYSSYAYILLSAVIQRAGKEPYHDQLMNRIAKPLGLPSLERDGTTNGQKHWTKGYLKSAKGEVVPAPEEAHDWKHGAGGYKSNVADFARWAKGLLDGQLVSKATEATMWERQKTADGKLTTWGLGFTVDEQGGLRVGHNGSQPEATSRMVLYPKAKQAVVVLTNCRHASPTAISTAIFSALREKK